MPIGLLIQTGAAAEDLGPLILGDTRPVILHIQLKPCRRLHYAQAHLGIRPFAGVVQQIAEQFQQVFTIPGQAQSLGRAVAQVQVFTVDHVQRRQQPR